LSGGFTFSFGLAIGAGKGPNPATAGSLAMGSIFSGTNPSVDVYTGDAGGSGGEASDPTSAVCFLFIGNTSN
jgi:hypothetical protein